MRKFILLIIPAFMSACVPLKDYNIKKAEYGELMLQNKELKTEVKGLKKQHSVLMDTLKKRNARNNGTTKVEVKSPGSTPAKPVAISNRKPRNPKGLTVQAPPRDAEHAAWIRANYSTDTNSAKATAGLKLNEKQIFYYLNKARLDPKGFLKKYILPLYNEDSTDIYVATLVDYMTDMLPLPALKPNKELYNSAICHARTTGSKGVVGHQRIDKSCPQMYRGECVSYGLDDALEVVLQLLIDDGVPSLGHRYICFGSYLELGVGQAPHKGYGVNTVLDFK